MNLDTPPPADHETVEDAPSEAFRQALENYERAHATPTPAQEAVVGAQVRGTIVSVGDDLTLVDFGGRSEAVVETRGFRAEDGGPPPLVLFPGEQLRYRVKYLFLRLAELRITTADVPELPGVVRVLLSARSNPSIPFFHIDSTFESLIGADGRVLSHANLAADSDNGRRSARYEMDAASGRCTVRWVREGLFGFEALPLPEHAHDGVTVMLLLRALSRTGGDVTVPTAVDGTWWPTTLPVGGGNEAAAARPARPHRRRGRAARALRRCRAGQRPRRRAGRDRRAARTGAQARGGRYATPYGLVRALKKRAVRLPLPGQDEGDGDGAVQLLTIHGANDLEARAVFVVDAMARPARPAQGTLLIDWPADAMAPRCCAFIESDSEARCPPSLCALRADDLAGAAREELNGLYVAMTRAKERLVVSATVPHPAAPVESVWQRLADAGVAPGPAEAAALAAPLPPTAPIALHRPPLEPAAARPATAPPAKSSAATHDEAAARSGFAATWPSHGSRVGGNRVCAC